MAGLLERWSEGVASGCWCFVVGVGRGGGLGGVGGGGGHVGVGGWCGGGVAVWLVLLVLFVC